MQVALRHATSSGKPTLVMCLCKIKQGVCRTRGRWDPEERPDVPCRRESSGIDGVRDMLPALLWQHPSWQRARRVAETLRDGTSLVYGVAWYPLASNTGSGSVFNKTFDLKQILN